jgi:E3 ubiquitin-protein ligase MARCH6
LCSIWLLLPPLLIGLLFESIIAIPFRTPLNETSKFPIIQSWGFGFILLKIWIRFHLVGGLGNEWRDKFEHVMVLGFSNIDVYYILKEIFIPIMLNLMDMIIFPFVISKVIVIIMLNSGIEELNISYEIQNLIVRFSYIGYVVFLVANNLLKKSYKNLVNVYNEIRDSRYLVGIELSNR